MSYDITFQLPTKAKQMDSTRTLTPLLLGYIKNLSK